MMSDSDFEVLTTDDVSLTNLPVMESLNEDYQSSSKTEKATAMLPLIDPRPLKKIVENMLGTWKLANIWDGNKGAADCTYTPDEHGPVPETFTFRNLEDHFFEQEMCFADGKVIKEIWRPDNILRNGLCASTRPTNVEITNISNDIYRLINLEFRGNMVLIVYIPTIYVTECMVWYSPPRPS